VKLKLAVEFFAAGLGEDLDAALAGPVELGGEGVLVDADFADGLLGWKAAAGETIDEDLAAAGAGGGPGEGLEVGGEVGGIVGESFELGLAEDEGAGVVGGVGIDAGGVGDGDLFGGGGEDEGDSEGLAVGWDVVGQQEVGEAFGGDGDLVIGGVQIAEEGLALDVRVRGFRGRGRMGEGDGRAGDRAPAGVVDLNAKGGLRVSGAGQGQDGEDRVSK
jgi:hypothetical protein